MKNLIFALLILFCNIISYAQSIGINESGTPPNPSALLDVKSTFKGLLVFGPEKSNIYLFDGQKWLPMLFAGTDAGILPVGHKASDGSVNDKFGMSVSISADYAIIGAYNENIDTKAGQGAAYIFIRQGITARYL